MSPLINATSHLPFNTNMSSLINAINRLAFNSIPITDRMKDMKLKSIYDKLSGNETIANVIMNEIPGAGHLQNVAKKLPINQIPGA
jgi:hypothetical protein